MSEVLLLGLLGLAVIAGVLGFLVYSDYRGKVERYRYRPTCGVWPKDDLRRAFVTGAAWWEFHSTGGTIWRSDRDLAEQEAERRYPSGKVRPEVCG